MMPPVFSSGFRKRMPSRKKPIEVGGILEDINLRRLFTVVSLNL